MKVVHADQKPFLALPNNVEAQIYDDNVRIVKLVGQDSEGKPTEVNVQKFWENETSITKEFEELCRELTNPSSLIGPEKLGPKNKEELDD